VGLALSVRAKVSSVSPVAPWLPTKLRSNWEAVQLGIGGTVVVELGGAVDDETAVVTVVDVL
jgi:hypothetical protein